MFNNLQKWLAFPHYALQAQPGMHLLCLWRGVGLPIALEKRLHPWEHVEISERTAEKIVQISAPGSRHSGWRILACTEEPDNGGPTPSLPQERDEIRQALGTRRPHENERRRRAHLGWKMVKALNGDGTGRHSIAQQHCQLFAMIFLAHLGIKL
jgi:hypothetical protein